MVGRYALDKICFQDPEKRRNKSLRLFLKELLNNTNNGRLVIKQKLKENHRLILENIFLKNIILVLYKIFLKNDFVVFLVFKKIFPKNLGLLADNSLKKKYF